MKHFLYSPKSIPQQCLATKAAFPTAKVKFSNKNVSIQIVLQPTEQSRLYPTNFILDKQGRCEVWVCGNIQEIDNPDFPHVYNIDKVKNRVQICLYLPNNGEWSSNMWLKDTLIPWAIEWLFFYELWIATGKWLGGGIHPTE